MFYTSVGNFFFSICVATAIEGISPLRVLASGHLNVIGNHRSNGPDGSGSISLSFTWLLLLLVGYSAYDFTHNTVALVAQLGVIP